ncbi:MAG: hypothetical protein H6767_00075 [Candidatus Peribacteria bacterium]|nr:MAG: hypothetical protein H6767_00075 [Candidatus Peribacteria bacterium]
MSYASFADGTGAIVAGNNISISGRLGYDTLSGSYTAGDINYAALGIESTNFSDPINGEKYKYGATMYGNRYELAATVENGGG